MHLCEIEALAVGQDGSGPSPVAEGQLPGAASIRSLGHVLTFARSQSDVRNDGSEGAGDVGEQLVASIASACKCYRTSAIPQLAGLSVGQ
jgi:organic hydroperoxide reductase OsmC/OhrA